MITAIVTRKGSPIPTVVKQLTEGLSEEHTKLLAEEHQKELKKNIEESRVRPKKLTGNHLTDVINIEKVSEGDLNGYGVGNINTLNKKAPWWAWINFGRAFSGRTVPPSDKGSFTDGSGVPSKENFRQGLWQHNVFSKDNILWGFTPDKAIQAHNFIERALGTMINKVRSLLR